MDRDELPAIFRESGAILEGHFIQTSGLHSPVFPRKARVFMHAAETERLCGALIVLAEYEVPACPPDMVPPVKPGSRNLQDAKK